MLFALLALCVFLIDEAIASNLPHFFEFGGQDAKLAMYGDNISSLVSDALALGYRAPISRTDGVIVLGSRHRATLRLTRRVDGSRAGYHMPRTTHFPRQRASSITGRFASDSELSET